MTIVIVILINVISEFLVLLVEVDDLVLIKDDTRGMSVDAPVAKELMPASKSVTSAVPRRNTSTPMNRVEL